MPSVYVCVVVEDGAAWPNALFQACFVILNGYLQDGGQKHGSVVRSPGPDSDSPHPKEWSLAIPITPLQLLQACKDNQQVQINIRWGVKRQPTALAYTPSNSSRPLPAAEFSLAYHSLFHSFIQQKLIEHLLCPGPCSKCWGCISEQNKGLP